ncbi:MAG: hypothetical protein HGA76_11470 [Candidatus Firestonebacteria bacterium]|nr:hypothetical protein [Candidatus Firestonebacteria bacterium]
MKRPKPGDEKLQNLKPAGNSGLSLCPQGMTGPPNAIDPGMNKIRNREYNPERRHMGGKNHRKNLSGSQQIAFPLGFALGSAADRMHAQEKHRPKPQAGPMRPIQQVRPSAGIKQLRLCQGNGVSIENLISQHRQNPGISGDKESAQGQGAAEQRHEKYRLPIMRLLLIGFPSGTLTRQFFSVDFQSTLRQGLSPQRQSRDKRLQRETQAEINSEPKIRGTPARFGNLGFRH